MKKIIISTMLVLTGIMVGCGINPNATKTVHATSSNYKEEDLGRIKMITYIDKDNGNVVYMSYDMDYSNGNRLYSLGMTSQQLNKK